MSTAFWTTPTHMKYSFPVQAAPCALSLSRAWGTVLEDGLLNTVLSAACTVCFLLLSTALARWHDVPLTC